MATPQERLADSLEALRKLQGQGVVAIQSRDLSRTDREQLVANGFLKEVIKGWYIPSRPDETLGDSTPWDPFWEFCAAIFPSGSGTPGACRRNNRSPCRAATRRCPFS